MTHKRTEIDRLGSQRRTKILRNRRAARLGLSGRMHKISLAGFERDHVLQIYYAQVAKLTIANHKYTPVTGFPAQTSGREIRVIESSSAIYFPVGNVTIA